MSDATIGLRTTNSGQRPKLSLFRVLNSVSPVLAGLVVAVPLAAVSMHIQFGPRLYAAQIFLAGAAAAVLLTRLLMQRDRHVALQLVVSEIVGENRSPEIAAERVLRSALLVAGLGCGIAMGSESRQKSTGVLLRMERARPSRAVSY